MVKYSPSESEEKVLSVEEVTVVTATFETFVPYNTFDVGAVEKIVEYKIKNTGNAPAYNGMLSFECAELNSDGTVKKVICRRSTAGIVGPNECLIFKGPVYNPCRDETHGACHTLYNGFVLKTLSEIPGTYYYGVKCWGADESEPAYPAIDTTLNNAASWEAVVVEEAHDTHLTVDIVDVAGNPITTAFVGNTIYISGQLSDMVTGELLTGATIKLFRNGVDIGLTDMTDESGVYSIAYTVVSGDVPSVRFKTKFEGA